MSKKTSDILKGIAFGAIILVICSIAYFTITQSPSATATPKVAATPTPETTPTTTPKVTTTQTPEASTATPITTSRPETILFHGHDLIRQEVPLWLVDYIENHDRYCCQWAESELTKNILAHFSKDVTKETFVVHEINKYGEKQGFIFYDSSMGRLQVGDTESQLNKPTVELEVGDDLSFELVLSILDRIKQSPTPEEEAKSVGLTPEKLAFLYDEEGWAAASERGAELLTVVRRANYWETEFWTTGYNHYIKLGSVDESDTEGLFIDGQFLSIVPDEYPVSFEEAKADWETGDFELGYNWFDSHSRSKICCDSDGKFFMVNDDCMVYTWEFDGVLRSANDYVWWRPTYEYPILQSDNVVVTDGPYYSLWYLATKRNKVEIFEHHFGDDSQAFGLWDQFTIEFKNATIVQSFVAETSDTRTAYIAVPESNTIWRISISDDFVAEIGYVNLDQVEIVNNAIYAKGKNSLTEIAFNSTETWRTTAGGSKILEEQEFETVAGNSLSSWWWSNPDMTTESRDGFMIIESDDFEITIK